MKNLILLLLAAIVVFPAGILAQEAADDEQKSIDEYYRINQGNLKFHKNRTNFNNPLNTEVKYDTLYLYNAWGMTMTMEAEKVPEHMTVGFSAKVLEPGQKGELYLSYDARVKNVIGQTTDYIKLVTNDTVVPKKRIVINPVIKEDFSGLTDEQRANAAKIVFEETEFIFDEVTSGVKVKHDFIFKNEGKNTLYIHQTKAGCGCTATNPEKTVLEPGESSKIIVEFNTARRKGFQSKTIMVYSNDPANPRVTLWIKGKVNEATE